MTIKSRIKKLEAAGFFLEKEFLVKYNTKRKIKKLQKGSRDKPNERRERALFVKEHTGRWMIIDADGDYRGSFNGKEKTIEYAELIAFGTPLRKYKVVQKPRVVKKKPASFVEYKSAPGEDAFSFVKKRRRDNSVPVRGKVRTPMRSAE